MMRPMCGSSSATSACVRGVSVTSDERGDVFAIASELVQQLADVRLRAHEDEQDRVRTEDGHDGEAILMLEHGGRERSPRRSGTELICGPDYRWNPRREIFCVEPGY